MSEYQAPLQGRNASVSKSPTSPGPSKSASTKIHDYIGQGGNGIVYLTEHSFSQKQVALKTLLPHQATERAIEDFVQEIRRLAKYSDPRIATIYDADTFAAEEGPRPYFTMEYAKAPPSIPTEALRVQWTLQRQRCSSRRALRWDMARDGEKIYRNSPQFFLMGFPGIHRLLLKKHSLYRTVMNTEPAEPNERKKSTLPAGEISFDEMYATLRGMARAAMKGERLSHTLQPTALVHEYLMKLPRGFAASPAENVAIVRLAGYRMRQILIDYARKRARVPGAVSRQRVELEAVDAAGIAVKFPDLELLDDLLRDLQKEQPEAAAVVEMRFFCELTHEEIAKALGVSVPTVERRWREAKEWIRKRMEAE